MDGTWRQSQYGKDNFLNVSLELASSFFSSLSFILKQKYYSAKSRSQRNVKGFFLLSTSVLLRFEQQA